MKGSESIVALVLVRASIPDIEVEVDSMRHSEQLRSYPLGDACAITTVLRYEGHSWWQQPRSVEIAWRARVVVRSWRNRSLEVRPGVFPRKVHWN